MTEHTGTSIGGKGPEIHRGILSLVMCSPEPPLESARRTYQMKTLNLAFQNCETK